MRYEAGDEASRVGGPALRVVFLVVLGAALSAGAAGESGDPRPPKTIGDLLACRGVADGVARLACFDAAAARLGEATASRDVVVLDRAEVTRTRRSLFGLSLPNLAIFGGGRTSQDEAAERQITAAARSASLDADGQWIVVLDDGARWHQIDGQTIVRVPRSGSVILIKRGALGSFIMNVDKQPGVKVRREN